MSSFFFRSMYNKTIIRFGFCDIQNNQGLGKSYQPQPSASADNPYPDHDYSGYLKTSSNNCLLSAFLINPDVQIHVLLSLAWSCMSCSLLQTQLHRLFQFSISNFNFGQRRSPS